jgi:DNA-binding NtrC family response regulator
MVTREVAHVLLTGDDISFLIVMEKLLRGRSYVCDCAHDVQTAAAALEARPYDLLIADLDLPGNRELELVRAGQGDGYSMPVIVLTGSPSVLTAVQSLYLAVVVEYLIKPVDPVELLRCVGPAVTTGRFWQAAFQTYNEVRARYNNAESLKRRVVSNELTQTKAQLSWDLETSLQQRGIYTDSLAEHCQEALGAGHHGIAGQVTDACALQHCPRWAAYAKSLRETIAILKKTKTASASKDLAAVRTKLEMLLKDA